MMNFIKNLFGNNNEEVQQSLQNGALVVDVRTASEYTEGHVSGSTNIPLQNIDKKAINKLKARQKPVVTCCRSGARSGAAAVKFKKYGINAINGGSWQRVQQLKRQQ